MKKAAWICILLCLAACVPAQRHSQLPASREQCRILAHKRIQSSVRTRGFKPTAERIPVKSRGIPRPPLKETPFGITNKTTAPTIVQTPSIGHALAHVADFTKDSSERGRTVSARTRTEKRPVHYPASESVELVAAQVRTVVTHGPNTGYVRENDLLVVFGGVLLSSTLLTYALRRRTKALSHWASRQPWKTRTLLTLIHLGTAFGSIALGKWYGDQGMLLSQNTLYAALTVFGLGTLLYPRAGTVSNRYQRRKIHDSLLFASATFLMLYTGNHEIPVAYTNGTQPREIFTGVSAKARSTQATAGEGRPQKGRLIGLKIILSLLAAALYVFLTLAVLALSCSLFCSGSGGLGLLVLVGGAAAVNFLGVVLIRAVWSIRTKVKPE